MTKEIDFLSLTQTNKATKIPSSTNSTNSSEKKEGLSLFDSLLENGLKEKENAESSTLSKENKSEGEKSSKETTIIKETNNNSKVVDSTKSTDISKELKNNEIEENLNKNVNDNSNKENSEEKIDITKDNKSTSSSSLLDRMIIEAKKNIKTTVDNVTDEKVTSNAEVLTDDSKKINKNSNSSTVEVGNKEISNDSEKTQIDLTKIDTLTNEEVEIKNSQTTSFDTNNTNKVLTDENLNKEKTNNLETKNSEVKNEQKTNVLKDAVQSTINFDSNTENENIEKKTILSSPNLDEENESNSSEKLKIEVKTELKTEVKTENKIEVKTELKTDLSLSEKVNDKKEAFISNEKTTINKSNNETVAKEFAKLDSSETTKEEQRVNINKDELLSKTSIDSETSSESKNTKSLMDRLFENAKNSTISSKTSNVNIQNMQEQNIEGKSNDVLTNIFLSSQKNSIYNQMVANKSEGVKVIKDAKNLEDVSKGAKILDLGLEDVSVETKTPEINLKKNNEKIENNDSLLDKLAFNRNLKKDEVLEKVTTPLSTTNTSSNTSATSTVTSSVIEQAVTLNVNPNLALTIQNRIIGAQQHMTTMMSDAARNMYENYKPPVTAFRINLFPSQLGHIAILMKNDKENTISISLNMSNSNTHDTFVENQNLLKEALHKNFNNNQTTFNLDFNMENESSNNQSFSQENQENQENSENLSSNEIIEAINENQDVAKDINYL